MAMAAREILILDLLRIGRRAGTKRHYRRSKVYQKHELVRTNPGAGFLSCSRFFDDGVEKMERCGRRLGR